MLLLKRVMISTVLIIPAIDMHNVWIKFKLLPAPAGKANKNFNIATIYTAKYSFIANYLKMLSLQCSLFHAHPNNVFVDVFPVFPDFMRSQ